ncbi:MAG: phospholipase, partial [Comamonadaceae bacterium]
MKALTRVATRSTKQAGAAVRKATRTPVGPPPGPGDWLQGLALGRGGARRFYVYRPEGLRAAPGQRLPLPLLLMLHGCGQD